MPFPAAPRLDDFGGDDVDQELGEQPAFGIALEMIGRIVPAEIRIEHQRQKQIVPVVDDNQLAAGAFEGRMVDEVFFGAVRADVAFEGELARDNFFDGDLLVPAVAAVLLLAARLGDVFGAAQRAPRLGHRFSGHASIYNVNRWNVQPTPVFVISR